MAKADSIEFRKPIRLGQLVDVRARVAFRGRSSMTVLVGIEPRDEPAEPCAVSGRFMMVAVGDDGLPIPILHSSQSHTEEAVS